MVIFKRALKFIEGCQKIQKDGMAEIHIWSLKNLTALQVDFIAQLGDFVDGCNQDLPGSLDGSRIKHAAS